MDKTESLLLQSKILLDRQYLLVSRIQSTQGQSLNALELALDRNEQDIRLVLDVYNYVFALIDHLARYQKIAHSIPKLNKKSPEYRALDESFGEIKDVRNQIQHLNNDIVNENKGPLLGSISWINNSNHYTAAFNDLARQRASYGIIYDTHTGEFKNKFVYNYNEKYHDLERAIYGLHRFQDFMNSAVKIKFGEEEYAADKNFAAFKFTIRKTVTKPQSSG